MVESLIDRVIVTDGEVEIRYVMPTDRASEQVRFCHLRLDYRARSPGDERLVRAMLRSQSFWSAAVTLAGIELMHMIRKGQLRTS